MAGSQIPIQGSNINYSILDGVAVLHIGQRTALLDVGDLTHLKGRRWTTTKGGNTYYVVGQRGISLHRLIMDAKPGVFVDHIDGDGLNNRRGNIRLCSHAENTRNRRKSKSATTSRFKGVYLNRAKDCWCCQIKFQGKKIYLGQFTTERRAAAAYDLAAIALHGPFASTNRRLGLFEN